MPGVIDRLSIDRLDALRCLGYTRLVTLASKRQATAPDGLRCQPDGADPDP